MSQKDNLTGNIFNIQRFSTHDGPGIRTVVFFKGCPLRCFWCQNPESHCLHPVIMHRGDRCAACGRCVSVCPEKALSIKDGDCIIQPEACTGCSLCEKICPHQAMQLFGYSTDVSSVMTEILKDRAYYTTSGGGITLSGGEATQQPDFALPLLEACKRKYIHTAVETCGFVSEATLKNFIPLTDLFLFDIKTLDRQKHQHGTGVDNTLILQNARFLAKNHCAIRIRMPLIPGFNDKPADVLALRDFVQQQLGLDLGQIDLLRYNPLGEVKYTRLGFKNGPCMNAQSDEYIKSLNDLLKM